MKLFQKLGKMIQPAERPEVDAARKSADRVIEASQQFVVHSDALAEMVKKMKGTKPRRQKRAKP